MPNVRRLRLHQVARELKVGQTTIVEYLEKKGIKVENAPSTLIEPHVYEVLDKEFGANKAETVNIREKINQKLEAVSLGNRKDGAPAEDDADFKKEVIIKSGVISVKDEGGCDEHPENIGQDRPVGQENPLQRLPKRRNLSFLRRRASRRLHPPQNRNPLRPRPSKANRFRSLPPRRLKPRRRHPLPLRPLRLCQPPHQRQQPLRLPLKLRPRPLRLRPHPNRLQLQNQRHSPCPLFRPVRPMLRRRPKRMTSVWLPTRRTCFAPIRRRIACRDRRCSARST